MKREDFRSDWDPRWSSEDEREYGADSAANESRMADGGPEYDYDTDFCQEHQSWKDCCRAKHVSEEDLDEEDLDDIAD